MSTYENHLLRAFPCSVDLLSEDELLEKVTLLVKAGTSFAVTVDHPYRLWLSYASAAKVLETPRTKGESI